MTERKNNKAFYDNWKPTPMTHSKLLTPSVSECPSPLELEFLLRKRFCGFLKLKENKKIETHSLKIAIKL